MTDKKLSQDVELSENEDVLEAHDPKNAEAQSVASVDAAADKAPVAKKRTGDKSNGEKMPKTKAGMVETMHGKLTGMKKQDLMAAYEKLMGESVEIEEDTLTEASEEFKDDLKALMSADDTLSEEFKEKAAVIFEAAVNSRVIGQVSQKESELSEQIAQRIEALEEQYEAEIAQGLSEAREEMVEKIDGYLNYVVETWMEDNKLAIEQGLRTEIAENFMNNLKNLFTESYIEVPESKVDLVDDLVEQVEELEAKLNKETTKIIEMREANEELQRALIIKEASKDLADTQASKLESMAEGIEFESADKFITKINTIKESYFKQSEVKETEVNTITESVDDESTEDEVKVTSTAMDRYLSALKK
jgi:hypothetical protein